MDKPSMGTDCQSGVPGLGQQEPQGDLKLFWKMQKCVAQPSPAHHIVPLSTQGQKNSYAGKDKLDPSLVRIIHF